MTLRLWIDDERPMPSDYNAMVLTSGMAISLISEFRDEFDVVSFDHDLGMVWRDGELVDDTSRRVLLWMIEHDVWPKIIRIHTANPVGHEWLMGTATRYAPEHVLIDPRNPNGLPPEFKNHG